MAQPPAIPIRTIADLQPDVIDALQGRTDVASIVPKYMRRSLQEITASTVFEELRTTGPTVSLTTGVSLYPVSTFLNPGDDVTSVEVFAIYVDFPQNTIVQAMDYKTPKAIEQMIAPATMGLPSRWSRYGTQIFLGPNPNQPYSCYMRYQVRHPFPDDPSQLSQAKVYVPPDWEEIIVYATALRIAVVKRWNDQVTFLHQYLYGDPEFMQTQGKQGRPGILSARLLQVERDQMFNSRQISVIVPRYTAH
jgi:hypothetical protein